MLSILLEAENFKIVESLSGKQAVRLCVSVNPDVILLDLGLPDMDGKAVITAIREWSQVPIVVLSSCAETVSSASTTSRDLLAELNSRMIACQKRDNEKDLRCDTVEGRDNHSKDN